MRLVIALTLGLIFIGQSASADDALKIIIGNHGLRSEREIARDKYRHPYETLSFFGLKSHMTVAEIQPGGGWYTRIIAPYLRDKGA